MESTVEKIFQDFKSQKISLERTIELLNSIIENNNDHKIRTKALETLSEIAPQNTFFYKYLENLLISDNSEKIRKLSAKLIGDLFLEKAFEPMNWALKFEENLGCKVAILKVIALIQSSESNKILLDQIEIIKSLKYLDDNLKSYKNKFQDVLKVLLESGKLQTFSQRELSEIIINFYIIKFLAQRFYSLNFQLNLENALVEELDLSDIEFEVRGWKSEFKNNISNASEISCITKLNQLKRLNLANNQLKTLKFLKDLPNLEELNISNNKIDESRNITFINNHPNLRYINLKGNKISMILRNKGLRNQIKVKTKNPYFY
jgi:Leucine-rich repeat (LRR) protein